MNHDLTAPTAGQEPAQTWPVTPIRPQGKADRGGFGQQGALWNLSHVNLLPGIIPHRPIFYLTPGQRPGNARSV